jgi:endonuclease/exonuclease/phosphatase family metal-dependent hydrolase
MLKLITWNIQSARSPTGSADVDGVLACLERFGDADILCLQEVANGFPARDGRDGGDQFSQLASALGGYHGVRALAVDVLHPAGGRRQLGSMVFSRHPILQVLRHGLPWPADPAVMSMPRVAIEVALDTPIGALRVLNAHLEYFSERQRMAQIQALRELQREAWAHSRRPRQGADSSSPFAAVPRPGPAVLLGDFNMLPDSGCYRAITDPFEDGTPAWVDAWTVTHPNAPHAPTVGLHGNDAPFTFDYAFASADLAGRVRQLRVGDGARGSDHQPVLLELA